MRLMQNRTQVFFIAGIIVVSIGAIILAAVLFAGKNTSSNFVATKTAAVTSSDHTRGAATSTVSVIEYGDFECPACGAYEPIVEQLTQQYGDRVQFVFRNFPLTSIHPNAMAGAEAAEAAGLQGKYWQMHDLLFAKQSEWSIATGTAVATDLNNYAKSLGLDITKFNSDMQSSAVQNKIQGDLASGTAASLDHTPTFFINLTQIAQPSADQFKADIDAALAAK